MLTSCITGIRILPLSYLSFIRIRILPLSYLSFIRIQLKQALGAKMFEGASNACRHCQQTYACDVCQKNLLLFFFSSKKFRLHIECHSSDLQTCPPHIHQILPPTHSSNLQIPNQRSTAAAKRNNPNVLNKMVRAKQNQ